MAVGIASYRRGLGLVAAGVIAAACGGGDGDGPGIVNAPVVVSVTVTPATVPPVDVGGTFTLTADVQVQNGASTAVTWASSAPNVATVSQTGVVTAVGSGQATITATSILNSSKSGSVSITVNAPVVVSVTVTPASVPPLDVGGTVTLNAAVQVQNGASTAVAWASSAPNVATVGQTGVVTAVGPGQATITATSVMSSSKSGSVAITVNAPQIVSVTVNSGARTIRVSESFSVTATVDARGNLARTVSFTSSNPAAVTVSSNDGLTANIVGVSAGQATITAKSTADATKTATIAVTVTGTVRITSVTPSPVSLQIGQQTKLTPTVQADPGISATVTYQSQSAAVATVSTDGTVTGVAWGQTGIIVAAVADPTQRVIVPVTVGDPCQIRNPLIIGATREGTITDASCNKLVDLYSYTVSAQTAITLGATLQFRGSFAFITHRTGWFSSAIYTGNGEAAWRVIVAPGTYEAFIKAEDVTWRGAYSITTSLTTSFASVCGVVATTGVTVTLPLNACGFQPAARPAGFYRSFGISTIPALAPDQSMTITVTASGFTPLIEARIGSLPPVTAVAPAGSNTVVQSFVGPPGNNVVFFSVSSVDPGQTGTFSVKIEGPPSQSATGGARLGQMLRAVP
jgi:uncharacterized protein YjdB